MNSVSLSADLIAIVCLSLAISGCGRGDDGPKLGQVNGNVTLDGEPLEGAVLIFNPVAGGRGSSGTTDSSGRYRLDYTHDQSGAILGEHQVRINSVSYAGEGAADPVLPSRYNSETDLTATVNPGSNTFDFVLKSEDAGTANKTN